MILSFVRIPVYGDFATGLKFEMHAGKPVLYVVSYDSVVV